MSCSGHDKKGLDPTLCKKRLILCRLFDKNGDGFVNKREFKWMVSKEKINKKQIDLTFKVYKMSPLNIL